MFVSHVRRPVDGSLLVLVESRIPHDFAAFAQRESLTVREWLPVSPSMVRAVDHPPEDFLDLCRYAFGRGFNRGLQDPKSDGWQYEPVFALCRPSPAEAFAVRELSLIRRLIEEVHENPLGYLLAELRVMGETHAKQHLCATS